jgi:Zn-dependent alcohol dehydrogenase|tara:strand:+ start:116 stop:1177 length:1062 start_codon:yes stop_codon:yes gene_type:complete
MKAFLKTQAAIQVAIHKELVIEELEIPEPLPDQVVVKLFSSGICYTQINQMHHPDLKRPLLLGHEGVGVVTHLGRDISHVKEGDHAIVSWIPRSSIKGNWAPGQTGVTCRGEPLHGVIYTWGEHVLTLGEHVVSIPSEFSDGYSCIVGCPVPSGAGAVLNTAKVCSGQSVVVFGMGGVGLSAICMASILGANPIIAVDIKDDKLNFAKDFGATHIVNASQQDPVKEIQVITNSGADFAFDATGVRMTAEQLLPSTRGGGPGADNHGGMSVLIGTSGTEITLDPRLILGPQRQYRGSLGAATPEKDFKMFLRLYKEGIFPLNKMVTRQYRLEQINEACEDLIGGNILGRAIVLY